MKKILTTTVYNLIASAIVMGIFTLIFVPFWVAVFIYVVLNLSNFTTLVLQEYVSIKNIKKLFFLVRYKRVKEINYSCKGCILNDNNRCKRRDLNLADKCSETRTIFAKRSFNIFSWIKKIFTLLLICTLLSGCSIYVNCNITKPLQNNNSQQDSTQIESQYWF